MILRKDKIQYVTYAEISENLIPKNFTDFLFQMRIILFFQISEYLCINLLNSKIKNCCN